MMVKLKQCLFQRPYRQIRAFSDVTFSLLITILKPLSTNGDIFARILYGDRAVIADHPYFAGFVHCGAAIISERYLITAAHCFEEHSARQRVRQAYVGGETTQNSQIVHIESITLHPEYFKLDGIPFNDVAIIRLRRPLRFSDKVQPVKLPTRMNYNRSRLVFVGRGTDETGNMSRELRRMDVQRLTVNECISLIPQQYHIYVQRYKNELSKINICATRMGNKPGMCFGDSGSPLVQGDVLVGLASYGGQSCAQNRLGFYVNVAFYTPWIKQVTGLN
ncbi:unnamed protein product [Leptosia nina]|uniref:Peptidase S1 domain-containing protein n=1 Tax=Leptosia nina TaxID=320188 RepID=A0AAV1IXX4_9NEOP